MLEVIADTLEPIYETWSDPGDYPSGAGSGPLPSYNYVEDFNGEVAVAFDREALGLEPEEALDLAAVEEWLADHANEIPTDVATLKVSKWIIKSHELQGDRLVAYLCPDEFECEVPDRGWED